MWKSKKVILTGLLAVALLVGSTVGIAFAQDETGDENTFEARNGALMDRVCQIYEENTGVVLDQEQLRNAFAEARGELAGEALQNRLQAMVDEGTITQEEADEYIDWLQAKPDTVMPGPGGRGFGPGGFGGQMHFGQGFN